MIVWISFVFFVAVHDPERARPLRWDGERSQAARPLHILGRTRAFAVRWRLQCGYADVRGEWRNHSSGVLCKSGVEALIVYVSPITHIVHIARGFVGRHDEGESAQESIKECQSCDGSAAQHHDGTVRAEPQAAHQGICEFYAIELHEYWVN